MPRPTVYNFLYRHIIQQLPIGLCLYVVGLAVASIPLAYYLIMPCFILMTALV